HCFDTSAVSALPLSGIDHLPGLIVSLLYAIPGFVEIEKYCNKNREAPEIFQDLDKCPAAQRKRYPFPYPLKGEERGAPCRDLLSALAPADRSLAGLAKDDHRVFPRKGSGSDCRTVGRSRRFRKFGNGMRREEECYKQKRPADNEQCCRASSTLQREARWPHPSG